jgi:hypothetical protein
MEIKGKIISVLPVTEGTGKSGTTWRKQLFVIETQEQYAKKVCIMLWGNNIEKFNIKEGELVNVGFDVESREFSGKWYTDVKAWKIDKLTGTQDAPPMPDAEPPMTSAADSDMDDLPF